MESINEWKEIDIRNRTFYYFDDIMSVGVLLNSYENNLFFDILYKTFMGAEPFRIRFDQIDGFIKIYDGTRYLALFSAKRYDAIYERIRYLISEKSGITDSFSHIFQESELMHIVFYL